MSHALYRLGRFSASRPWMVIGAWLGALVLVVGASAGFGRELTDSFEVPGLDSQQALDLLAEAQSDQAGLTAQVVATPRDGAGFFGSNEAVADLERVQESIRTLDGVLSVNDVTSGMPRAVWLRQQSTLRRRLRAELGVSRLLVSGVPPMGGFPALPLSLIHI